MTNVMDAKDRLARRIDEVREKLETLMVCKGMVADEEVVILSQNLDKLIIQYYRRDESEDVKKEK